MQYGLVKFDFFNHSGYNSNLSMANRIENTTKQLVQQGVQMGFMDRLAFVKVESTRKFNTPGMGLATHAMSNLLTGKMENGVNEAFSDMFWGYQADTLLRDEGKPEHKKPFMRTVLTRLFREFDKVHNELLKKDSNLPSYVKTAIEDYIPKAVNMFLSEPDFSEEQYVAMSAFEAILALVKGNYGIGAVYSIKKDDEEFLISGQNGLFTKGFAFEHAEHSAMHNVVDFAKGNIPAGSTVIASRKLDKPVKETESRLITSLEPCAMCLLGSLNHLGQVGTAFKGITIGHDDVGAGSAIHGREEELRPVWQFIYKAAAEKGFDVRLAQFQNPEHTELLRRVFEDTREEIDLRLGKNHKPVVSLDDAVATIKKKVKL
jgi:tRNA(Arg) A34 adenosine deaminase TadA